MQESGHVRSITTIEELSHLSVPSWIFVPGREQILTPPNEFYVDNKQAPNPNRCTDIPPSPRLLACPFTKNFPARQRELRACMAGWRTIPRVKQHLARCHAPEISCRRCHKPFKTEQDLDSHSQTEEACTVMPPSKTDETRMTASAHRILHRRTRRGESPERAWIVYYRTLFPEVPMELIPSPYLNITKDDIDLTRQDAARELWRRIDSMLPHIIEEVTRGMLLSGSSSELAARLLARISKVMNETLGTEEKAHRHNLLGSSVPNGDADLSMCSMADFSDFYASSTRLPPERAFSAEDEI